MAWRLIWKLRKVLVIAVLVCFFVSLYLGSASIPVSYGRNYSDGRGKFFATGSTYLHNQPENEEKSGINQPLTKTHHLGVIVPFRDRFEELLTFVPYIHRYLSHKGISHEVIVVNQVDSYRFNRASLINAGFLYATSADRKDGKPCDYIAMHDVDLLPLNQNLPYEYPEEGSVMHVAAPGLHPKYNYPSFIGGILLVSVPDFYKVNGMSNVYWGWGMEDDEFYVRLRHGGIEVKRPLGITTDTTNTFRHAHSPRVRPRDMTKCYDQFNKTKRRDRITGLSNFNYTLISTSTLTIDGAPLVLLNVRLQCDTEISPWCDCRNATTSGANGKGNNTQQQNSNKNKNKSKQAKKLSKKL